MGVTWPDQPLTPRQTACRHLENVLYFADSNMVMQFEP